MKYRIEIEVEDIEYQSLQGEYTVKGLYSDWPGHNRSPKENVIKKIVEAVAKEKEAGNGKAN